MNDFSQNAFVIYEQSADTNALRIRCARYDDNAQALFAEITRLQEQQADNDVVKRHYYKHAHTLSEFDALLPSFSLSDETNAPFRAQPSSQGLKRRRDGLWMTTSFSLPNKQRWYGSTLPTQWFLDADTGDITLRYDYRKDWSIPPYKTIVVFDCMKKIKELHLASHKSDLNNRHLILDHAGQIAKAYGGSGPLASYEVEQTLAAWERLQLTTPEALSEFIQRKIIFEPHPLSDDLLDGIRPDLRITL